MATVPLVGPRIALRVVVVVVLLIMAAIVPIQLRRTQAHPSHHQEAAVVVVEGPVAPRIRAGRERVRLLLTRLPKCGHSRRFEKI